MPLSTAGANAALSGGLGNAISHVSAHTDHPGSAGSNEVAGGSYARQAVTWNAAGSGLRTNNGALSIPIPASTTVVAVGLFSALTSGTYYGFAPIGASLIRGVGSADATADTITSKGHGLANADRVIITDAGETLPAGLSESTIYFVVGTATDTFQVSLTSGGAAVNITANGEVVFQQTKPEVFTGAGTLTVPDTSLVLDATAFGVL